MNAKIDQNGEASLIAVLNTTGRAVQRIQADPTTHRLHLNDGTTGSDQGPKNAMIDDNFKRTLIAVSRIDHDSIVTAYGDSSSKLLVNTT